MKSYVELESEVKKLRSLASALTCIAMPLVVSFGVSLIKEKIARGDLEAQLKNSKPVAVYGINANDDKYQDILVRQKAGDYLFLGREDNCYELCDIKKMSLSIGKRIQEIDSGGRGK